MLKVLQDGSVTDTDQMTLPPMAGMEQQQPPQMMPAPPELRGPMEQPSFDQNMSWLGANNTNPLGDYYNQVINQGQKNQMTRKQVLEQQINNMMGKAVEPRSKLERAADVGEGVWGAVAAPLLSIFGAQGAAEGAADYLKGAGEDAMKRRDQYERRRDNSVGGLKTMMDMLEKAGPVSQTQLENMTNQMKLQQEHDKAMAQIATQNVERQAAIQEAEHKARLHPLQLEKEQQGIYAADQSLIHNQNAENRAATDYKEKQAQAPNRATAASQSLQLQKKQIDEYAVKAAKAKDDKEKAAAKDEEAFHKGLPAEHMTPDQVTKVPASVDFVMKKHGVSRDKARNLISDYWRSKVGDTKNGPKTTVKKTVKTVSEPSGSKGDFGPKHG